MALAPRAHLRFSEKDMRKRSGDERFYPARYFFASTLPSSTAG
jgi:hypothetical protein